MDCLDFVDHLVSDPATRVILLLLERVKSSAKLLKVGARAAAARKPIVVLKLGKTAAGSAAVKSHSGALTGSYDGYQAVFRKCGFMEVDDFDDLYNLAMLLRLPKRPKGRGIAAAGISGGNVILVADVASKLGLSFPELSAETVSDISRVLPDYTTVTNPIDLTDPSLFPLVLGALAADGSIDFVIPIMTLADSAQVQSILESMQVMQKPSALLWTGGSSDGAYTVAGLVGDGVPAYDQTRACLLSVKKFCDWELSRPATAIDGVTPPDISRGQAALKLLLDDTVPEMVRIFEVLQLYGIPCARQIFVNSIEETVVAGKNLGFPVALKIVSGKISHKSDVGGVRLNVQSATGLRRAAKEMSFNNRAVQIDGFLIQEMAGAGLELFAGVARHDVFGPLAVVGAGGIFVEQFRDVAYVLPPVDRADAYKAIQELRLFPLLVGVRGQQPYDVQALIDTIKGVADLGLELIDKVVSLDINPLLVRGVGRGVMALDARVEVLS